MQLPDRVINDPRDIATALNVYFVDSLKNMKQNPGHVEQELAPMPLNTEAPMFVIHAVSQSQVDKVICGLKNSRAKDTFGIDLLFLKTHKQSFIAPLTKLGVFPDSWKYSIITPILKSGDPTMTSNYRPISILPSISNIAEKLVAEQLIPFKHNSIYVKLPAIWLQKTPFY